MREAAENITREVKSEIESAYLTARNELSLCGGDLSAAYRLLPPRCRKVIDVMGGMEAFAPPDRPGLEMQAFQATYERMLRAAPVGLPAPAPHLTDAQKKAALP